MDTYPMSLRVTFDLSDEDLKHFEIIMRQARKTAAGVRPEDIVESAERLLWPVQKHG